MTPSNCGPFVGQSQFYSVVTDFYQNDLPGKPDRTAKNLDFRQCSYLTRPHYNTVFYGAGRLRHGASNLLSAISF